LLRIIVRCYPVITKEDERTFSGIHIGEHGYDKRLLAKNAYFDPLKMIVAT